MQQTPGGTPPLEKKSLKDSLHIIMKVGQYVVEWKKECIILVATILLTIVCQLTVPILVQRAINALIYRTDSTFVQELTRIITALVFVFIANSLIEYIKNISAMKLSENMSKKMRSQLFDRMVNAPLSYLDKVSFGDLMSRLTNDSARVSTVAQVLQEFLSKIVIIIGSAIIMLIKSPRLAVISIITALITTFISAIISGKMREYFMKQTMALGSMNAHIEETMKNTSTIEMAGVKDYVNQNMRKKCKDYTDICVKSSMFSGIINPIMLILGNLSFMVTLVVGAKLSISGAITIGVLQAVIMYSKQFMDSVYGFGNVMIQTQSFVASAERIFEIMDIQMENKGTVARLVQRDYKAEADSVKISSTSGIEFSSVSFSYDGETKVLSDVDIHFEKGQSTAIVGSTGAGKTTLINLLLRFYDNYEGDIILGGKNLKDLSLKEIREKVTVVLQDCRLVDGTVCDNILYGTDKTKKDAEEIIRIMGVEDIINFLPDGLETAVSDDDESVSQGMREIIGLARALVRKPEILVMDEALSAVDNHTEEKIRGSILERMKNITMILIAHRLDTTKDCDTIVVMKKGEVFERGTHAELISENGEYSRLYNSQLAGESL